MTKKSAIMTLLQHRGGRPSVIHALVIALLLGWAIPLPVVGSQPSASVSESSANPVFQVPFRFTVLHTNDLHSSMGGLGPDGMFTPQTGDGDPVLGHYARLMTAIRSVRAERKKRAEPALLVDAGDPLFGSLYHILGPTRVSEWVPEYRFFDWAGYDALCLGNHDFDAAEAGLACGWKKSQERGYRLPFVTSNLQIAAGQESSCPLASFKQPGGLPIDGVGMQEFQVRDLSIPNRENTLRIGIIGLLGPDAAQLSVASRKTVQFAGFQDNGTKQQFDEFVKLVQTRVDHLRNERGCHLVLAMLHGGAPEDEQLAAKVKGLDILIAGHTHLPYVKTVGSTIIAQTGHGAANLGCLDFEFGPKGLVLLNPETPRVAVDDRIPAAPDVLAWLEEARREIDRLIAPAGFRMNDPICAITRDRRKALFPNNEAGVFTATTLRRSVNRSLANPVDLYLSSFGMVRADYLTVNGAATPQAFSDIFRFSPLGFDDEGRPGAPIVVFSLSPLEIKMVLEIMTHLSRKTRGYEPAASTSLRYRVNPRGIPLVNRVTDLTLHGQPFRKWPKRVRIATTLFFARNLLQIREMSKGLLRITPRDDAGEVITEFKDSGLPREHLLLAGELRRVANGEVSEPDAQP